MAKKNASGTQKQTLPPADEFIYEKGVSAWDDINSTADDEWAKGMQELAKSKEFQNKKVKYAADRKKKAAARRREVEKRIKEAKKKSEKKS